VNSLGKYEPTSQLMLGVKKENRMLYLRAAGKHFLFCACSLVQFLFRHPGLGKKDADKQQFSLIKTAAAGS